MAFKDHVRNRQQNFRCSFTTGTCAALAAKAAAMAIIDGKIPDKVSIITNKGIKITVPIENGGLDGKTAWCSIIRDAGDESDLTNGKEIISTVELTDDTGVVEIDGGVGIGRITKQGLEMPCGSAAIYPGPRASITFAVSQTLSECGYPGGAKVVVSIPEGEKLARRTYNSMIGIEGGLSVLGTTNIIEPMSERALLDAIEDTIIQAAIRSDKLILTPGKFGEAYINREGYRKYCVPLIKSSNFIGDVLDMAASQHFKQVILIAHTAKLCKLSAGIMNTYSKNADGRNEVFCTNAALSGANMETLEALEQAQKSDECIEILDKAGIRGMTITKIMNKVQMHLEKRVAGAFEVGAVMFSNVYGTIGKTWQAEEILRQWEKEIHSPLEEK